MDISKLNDQQLNRLVEDRFASSNTVWSVIKEVYERNVRYYDSHTAGDSAPDYINKIPVKQHRVRANRIFVNTESVINSLIANPPKPNVIPGREGEAAIEVATKLQSFYGIKYVERNVKETKRKALRNLYFSRLAALKYFWNPAINDVDAVALDPRKVRIAKNATCEEDTEFVIEEVSDNLCSVLAKFPAKKEKILEKAGFEKDADETEYLIKNPEIQYKEAHFNDYVIFTYSGEVLHKMKNPYWDWDGIPMTEEQSLKLADPETSAEDRKATLEEMRQAGDTRKAEKAEKKEGEEDAEDDKGVEDGQNAYRFNHFDRPRKPYIFATILNNENTPVGRTSFIEQAIPLQESIDRRKRQIDRNSELLNGILKVDATVMDKADAQKLRFETEGVIWGNGVVAGVQRETGPAIPQSAYQDMVDSRNELDNVMAATSAFRGEREGTETKAGRLALIEQSALRLNELVQVSDYMDYELFNGWFQLGKVFYTERHYAKSMGPDGAAEVVELTQDDFEDGTEIRVIAGKTLPEDQGFRYERAQADAAAGRISPTDYLREAGYNDPMEVAKNAELYKINPIKAVGITDEELKEVAPPGPEPEEEKPRPPTFTVPYEQLPAEAQVQVLALAGIEVQPESMAPVIQPPLMPEALSEPPMEPMLTLDQFMEQPAVSEGPM